ncbi:hypothetical protein [Psychrobacter sp. FDAARGOS_221]|uniref:hypothetical protein n=1 Tax=Psychrobacter sp. FDAARGOS_221 TaxID=1975705 RepID=UPI000BB53413|nr:hypothetical protein [Psychrobacter sp. FDAARGOS_221]PNK59669.1 hypothetical protein A6J60_001405 [Psychrobacter sp. FDAARGOS_221]
MPSLVFINEQKRLCFYKFWFYEIFEYSRQFIDDEALEFKLYLPIECGMDYVSLEELNTEEFNATYKMILKGLRKYNDTDNAFIANELVVKEWIALIDELEKDERFEG